MRYHVGDKITPIDSNGDWWTKYIIYTITKVVKTNSGYSVFINNGKSNDPFNLLWDTTIDKNFRLIKTNKSKLPSWF